MNPESFEQLHFSLEREGRLAVVRLDHGKVNACGSAVVADFERLSAGIAASRSIRGLLIHSSKVTKSGKPVFVAGADVTERVGWTEDQVIAHVARQRLALLGLRSLPVFTVAVVKGIAFGLGTELMLAADYRIAAPGANFALPETGLGIIPGALGSSLLADLVGKNQALRLGCTGENIDGVEALRIGLVDELGEDAEAALARAYELCARALSRAPRALAAFKQTMLEAQGLPVEARVALEAAGYREQVRNGDAAIGRAHFADIRAGKTPPYPDR